MAYSGNILMGINRKSIRFKVIVPIAILIILITLTMLFAVKTVSQKVSEDYHNFSISVHSREVKGIVDRAINELLTAQLFDQKIVVESKKKAAIDEISSYWSANNIDGLILASGNKTLYSSLSRHSAETLMPYLPEKGHFYFDKGAKHLQGYVLDLPVWDWKIVTVPRPTTVFLYRSEILLLLPLITFGSLLMFVTSFFILRKNFQQPIGRLISDIKSSRHIRETGISELDTIGSAINDAFRKLNRKTDQHRLLHNIAISLHVDSSTDKVLNLIISKAGQLIGADLAAIAVYDDNSKFRKFLTKDAAIHYADALPEGKGLLEFVRLSVTPVRIDNVAEHPAFSGSFPEGHPPVKNLLAYPIFSGGGRPVGALYFGNKQGGFTEEDEDILEGISADAAIALNRAERITQLRRFQQVINSAFDIIIITDDNGYIIYTNPALETITGYSRKEAIGKKPNILKSGYHDDAFYKNLWSTIKAGDIWKGEFINRKKSGEIYYASTVIFPIHTEGEVYYAGIQRDITQEKRLYEQLLRSQKMEAIGTLAGGIAHDFNNLLTAILGYSEIMLSSLKEGDPFFKPANIIYNAAGKGADLAKKILTVARKEKLETKPVNVNEIIENSLELLRRSIPKNIEIVTSLMDNIPMIKADPSQIQQVIMNLAVNARDAMPDGGMLTIETALVGAENGAANDTPPENCFVKVSISDTGIGMDIETQRRIFDPFFTTKETGKGTGLGLYIVHSVISNHGGYINLYSEAGKGTRFNIYLPVTNDAGKEETAGTEDIRGSETILIIDDDVDVRELCRDMLEPLGYTIISAGNGIDGINIFRQMKDKIALVILDMIMPKMSGNEVFHALKNIKSDVKVSVCSGYSHNGFAGIDTLLKSGAKSFIQKPFTRQTLAHAVRKSLTD